MKVFIANLDYKITVEQLREMFLVFGFITECKLINDPESGKSKGYGFVVYAKHIYAQWAIKAMNGMNINGRLLAVRKAKPDPNDKTSKPKRARILVGVKQL